MSTQIELMDQRRRKYRGGHVVGLIFLLLAWISRAILKTIGVENETLYVIILIVILLAVLVQAYYAIKIRLLKREINNDSIVVEALNDELVRFHQLKAWKISFFSVIVIIAIGLILSIFIPIKNMGFILVTALIFGFGTYITTLYLLDR